MYKFTKKEAERGVFVLNESAKYSCSNSEHGECNVTGFIRE
jgi:hypothetical protein